MFAVLLVEMLSVFFSVLILVGIFIFLSPQSVYSKTFYLGYVFTVFYIANVVVLSITLFDIKKTV